MTPARSVDDMHGADPDARADAWAARALGWPISAALGVLCLGQLATWVPGYLTWPWWADHDVFATAARAWDAGLPPYRGLLGNNFPGTTYVFWLLGKSFGWGSMPAFWAFDVGLVLAFGALLAVWSRARFGRVLPGLAGWCGFLSVYLGLDYSQAAQRDWQGPFFAVASILVLQSRSGRWAVPAAGLLTACGLAIRPQAVLFAVGSLAAIVDRSRDDRGAARVGPAAASIAAWSAAVAAGLALAAAPLAAAGALGDFLRSLRAVAPGGGYSQASGLRFVREAVGELASSLRWTALPAILWLGLRRPARVDPRDPLGGWLMTYLCVSLYKPLSPVTHEYLIQPLTVCWMVLLAIFVDRVSTLPCLRPSARLAGVVLGLSLVVVGRPRSCDWNAPRGFVEVVRGGGLPRGMPEGYRANLASTSAAFYRWEDYRDALGYVRSGLPASTRVANALGRTPAITGPAGRLPAFPAESIAWIVVVDQAAEPAFRAALKATPDSVVVWSPGEFSDPKFRGILDPLDATIRELYEPDRAFGAIEIWRRRGRSPAPTSGAGGNS